MAPRQEKVSPQNTNFPSNPEALLKSAWSSGQKVFAVHAVSGNNILCDK